MYLEVLLMVWALELTSSVIVSSGMVTSTRASWAKGSFKKANTVYQNIYVILLFNNFFYQLSFKLLNVKFIKHIQINKINLQPRVNN